eukprot:15335721-Ditylum_brightwellii.AAC.1
METNNTKTMPAAPQPMLQQTVPKASVSQTLEEHINNQLLFFHSNYHPHFKPLPNNKFHPTIQPHHNSNNIQADSIRPHAVIPIQQQQ